MSEVLLIATGDTIAYGRRAGMPAVHTGADLLAALPADRIAADVTPEDVRAEPAWDMSPATMLALARRVRAAILDDGYDGVVVTHGTDTVEETAFLVASRCRTGDRELAELGLGAGLAAGVGAIGARGLPAPKARLALMVALGAGSAAGARQWFSEL